MDGTTLHSIIAALLTAIGCGSLLGAEREWTRHDAGLRTNALVSFGAAVFTLVGIYGYAQAGLMPDDRVAAQVVTGIGFLGAGVILQRRRRVIGLTTAATLWVAAAVGIAAGSGLLSLAWIASGLVLLLQLVLRVVELRLDRMRLAARKMPVRYHFRIQTAHATDLTLQRIVEEARADGGFLLLKARTDHPGAEGQQPHEVCLTLLAHSIRPLRLLKAQLTLAGFEQIRICRLRPRPEDAKVKMPVSRSAM